MKKIFNNSGFTLMEMVVAVGIFSILSLMLAGIFLSASNMEKNTANSQRLQNDGRYILEKIAREIRGRELEAPIFSTSSPVFSFLPDEFGNKISICFNSSTQVIRYYIGDDSQTYIDTRKNCEDYGEDLNAADVAVEDAYFYVKPTMEDGWKESGEDLPILQPRVTIAFKIKNRNLRPEDTKELFIQTTISSKVYR